MERGARVGSACLADVPTCTRKVNLLTGPLPPYTSCSSAESRTVTRGTAREKRLCSFGKK